VQTLNVHLYLRSSEYLNSSSSLEDPDVMISGRSRTGLYIYIYIYIYIYHKKYKCLSFNKTRTLVSSSKIMSPIPSHEQPSRTYHMCARYVTNSITLLQSYRVASRQIRRRIVLSRFARRYISYRVTVRLYVSVPLIRGYSNLCEDYRAEPRIKCRSAISRLLFFGPVSCS